MAATTWTVSNGAPLLIAAAGHSNPITVANLDPTLTVMLAADNNGLATAIPLTAGSTIQWDVGRALYAFTTAGSVSLLVLDTGGRYDNGRAVANSLMTSGLAKSIADNITVNGVPTIDTPSTLLNMVAISDAYSSPALINCSKYATLNVMISHLTGDVMPRQVSFEFYNDDGFSMGVQTVSTGGLTGTITKVQALIPITGSQFVIRTGGTGVPFTGEVTAIGSYRPTTTYQWARVATSSNQYDPGTSTWLGNGTLTTAPHFWGYKADTPTNFAPLIVNMGYTVNMGKARLVAVHDGSAGTFYIGFLDTATNLWYAPVKALTTGQQYVFDFYNPGRPMDLYIGAVGVVGPIRATLTTEY